MFYYTKNDKQICFYNNGQKLHEFKIINGATYAWETKEYQGVILNRLIINCAGLSQYVVEFGDNIYRMRSYALGQLHGYQTDIDKRTNRFLEKIYHNGQKYQMISQSDTSFKKISKNLMTQTAVYTSRHRFKDGSTIRQTIFFDKNHRFHKGIFKKTDSTGDITEFGHMNGRRQKDGYVVEKRNGHKKLCLYKNGIEHFLLRVSLIKKLLPFYSFAPVLLSTTPVPIKTHPALSAVQTQLNQHSREYDK